MTALSEREQGFIVDSLQRLREHFKIWDTYEDREYQLAEFAIYENCYKDAASGLVVAQAAPFALGKELVNYYGFEWVIVQRNYDIAAYAVQHPNLNEPIDLLALEDGIWSDEQTEEMCDEPPVPGQRTLDSLEPILKAAKLRLRYDRNY